MKKHIFSFLIIFIILSSLSFSYTVRKGDTLGVWVLGYPEYSIEKLIVGPQGDITVPPIGRVMAEGKTLEELEKEISLKMESYIKTNKITVGITQYALFPVTVLGNTNVNGIVDIKSEKIKLSELIGLVGGIKDISKSSYALIKGPDGSEQRVNVEWIKTGQKGEDPYIYQNYFVLFPFDYSNNINIFSEFGTSSLNYFEGMTLKSVLASINIPTNKISSDIIIIRNSQIMEVNFEKILKEEDFALKPGDTLIIPHNYTNKVLVFSDFGSVSLDFFQGMGIKALITLIGSNAGISMPISQINDQITIIRGTDVIDLSLENITKGNDFLLQPGDSVLINKSQQYVYLISEELSKRVDFEKNETMNVRTLLVKTGINESSVEEVRVNNEIYDLESMLQTGDFVQIKAKRNYVYLSGAFVQPGKVTFLPQEDITLDKILAISKGFAQDFSGNLIIIEENGISKNLKVDPYDLSSFQNINIMPGSTIIADTELKVAYIFGEFSDAVQYKNGQTLFELLIPFNLNESYEIRYQISDKSEVINASETDKLKKVTLSGKVFLEIAKTSSSEVIVYKAGETQVIQNKIVRLIDVFSSVNGFAPVDKGTIEIYKDGEIINKIDSQDLLNNLMLEIPQGSYVYVKPDLENSYIAVLGNINPKSIRSDVPLSLVEILSTSQIDWKNQELVYIYTEKNEEIKVNVKDIDSLRNVLVKPGSIVYVPPTEELVVYVFGEVARPGLVTYNPGMTVLDAILKAGNASKTAQMSTVYLFKDGPENPPVSLDLAGINKAAPIKTGMNPEIKPKDIIFIPKNALTSVVEVMSTVQMFMSFINAGVDTYQNITEIF